MASPVQPVFYFDLLDAECWLAAERVNHALPVVPEWTPVLRPARAPGDRDALERRAAELELLPTRWPRTISDGELTALAATYAKNIGRAVAFSLALFRQAFAAGRDPGAEDTILIAAAACEVHPAAMLKGARLRSTATALEANTAAAADLATLPAVRFEHHVLVGESAIDAAEAPA